MISTILYLRLMVGWLPYRVTTTQEERPAILRRSQAKVHVVTTENTLLVHVEFHEFTYMYMYIRVHVHVHVQCVVHVVYMYILPRVD